MCDPYWNTRHRTKCRHTDDMLEGNPNVTAEVQFPRAPAAFGSLTAISRAMAGSFMGTLQGFPSESFVATIIGATQRRSSAGLGLASLRVCPPHLPSGTSVTPSLSSSRRAGKRRCPPESLPTSSLDPQSSPMRQVELRRRCLQQFGHLKRGRDREQSSLESSAARPASRKNCHETVETFRLYASPAGIALETVQRLDQALVWYLNEKFFLDDAVDVASEILAAVAHEWTGISMETKECLRAVQTCRGWHRLNLAKSHPTIASNAFSSRTSKVRGLSQKVGSAAVCSLQNGATEEKDSSWAAKRTRSSNTTLSFLAFGRQSQMCRALAQTALQRHVRGLLRSRRIVELALALFWQRLSGPASARSSRSRISQ